MTMQEAYWMKVASGKIEKIIYLQKLVKKWLAMKNQKDEEYEPAETP